MTNYLSFDVEDWFHAHNLRPSISPSDWDDCESRVERSTGRILDLLDAHDVTATFFVLGWVADRHPELVGEIADAGHEVASHGYNHELLHEQSPEAVERDLRRSLEVLEPLVDGPIQGYRAPSFSITDWALPLLRDLGFAYDSSSFDVSSHDRYGALELDQTEGTFVSLDGLVEARLAQLSVGPISVPWAGGGYFRFVPFRAFRHGVRRITRDRDFVFYLHPWELDPSMPRVDGLPLQNRVRHYTNLSETERRLERLLEAFDWQPIGDAPEISGP